MSTAKRYVAYLRVSTDRQGRSGLGLEAQRAAVAAYLAGGHAGLVGEIVEVESGKRKDRPKLTEAIALCRAHRAVLLVAKLDRLARNAAFLLSLRDAGIEFVACDMPDANRVTVGILAVVAEAEAEMISGRTKAALKAAKERGTVLGGFRGRAATDEDARRARSARTAKALGRARDIEPVLSRLDPDRSLSLRELAALLNAEGIPTATGRGQWTAAAVSRVKARFRGAGSAAASLLSADSRPYRGHHVADTPPRD
ncbi:recombinase family protein [Ancylobacter sp. VNQ12]|uniref:recombinase family protein n=1 Tax=Ancylobacter sp. VNQ12 TaxID=3400920 RepID=UPI003C026798